MLICGKYFRASSDFEFPNTLLGKQDEEKREVAFTVTYQKDFDHAIVVGLLDALGLKTAALLEGFSNQYYKGGFPEICLAAIRKDRYLLSRDLKTAKATGQVLIRVSVAVPILKQIAAYLTSISEKNVTNRVTDAGYQSGSGIVGAARGAILDAAEATSDQTRGIVSIAQGATDGLTSSVNTPRFNQGWNQVYDGLFQLGKGQLKLFLQTPADFFLMNDLKMASAVQTLLFLESSGRLLTGLERMLLEPIFKSSVQYEAIRIKEGFSGLLHLGYDPSNRWGKVALWNTRALTIGNTIYMKNTAPDMWNEVLAHETTHVWQHQNGGTDYLLECLFAQTLGEGYSFADAITRQNRPWAGLNPEQQGFLIQMAYVNDYFRNGGWSNIRPIPDNAGNFISQQVLINYMNQVVLQLRTGMGAT